MLTRTCAIASFALWLGAVPALAEPGPDAERLSCTLRPTSHEARWLIAEGQALAHELVHVLEVVNAADVSSQADVTALYSRIGEPAAHGRYESLAARRVSCLSLEEALGRMHLVASADVAPLIAR